MENSRNFVNFQVHERIVNVIVDRPPVNALNNVVEAEINEIFEEIRTMREAGVVIISGGGDKSFIAGADIKSLLSMGPEEASKMSASTQKVLSNIASFDKVVIAAVNGLALGGGCEVALACDLRIADESAIFGFPEVCLGLMPGAGGTQRLSRLVGMGRAKKLILTGDPISAAEALEIGLVEKIALKGEAITGAKKIAERILLRGPVAVANAKKAIHEGMNMTFENGLVRETELFSALFNTKDMKKGVKAFIEKRSPNFTGK
jgi:enoyl-CoA hydratase